MLNQKSHHMYLNFNLHSIVRQPSRKVCFLVLVLGLISSPLAAQQTPVSHASSALQGNTTSMHPAGEAETLTMIHSQQITLPVSSGNSSTGASSSSGSASLLPPVNDLCTSVTPLPIAPNSSATFSGNTIDASPEVDGPTGATVPVVWEAFSLSEYCSSVTLELCGSESILSIAYTVLYVSCDGFAVPSATFNWDDCGDGNPTLIFENLYPGTYYYPVVGAFSQGESTVTPGPYTLQVTTSSTLGCTPTPLPNCEDQPLINLEAEDLVVVNGSTIGIAIDPDFASFPVVWYQIELTGLCNDLEFSFCGSSSSISTIYATLYSDCSSSENFEEVAEGSAVWTPCGAGGINLPTVSISGLEPGLYYYPVAGVSPVEYEMQVSVTSCFVPPNDLCEDAENTVLSEGVPSIISGNTTNATPDPLVNSEIPIVWHSFTVNESCTALRVSYCGSEPEFEAVWAFLATDCIASGGSFIQADSLNWDICDSNGFNPQIWFFDLPAGTYYYGIVGAFSDENVSITAGPYSVELTAFSCTPDCNGEYGGTAYLDDCGLCVGGSTGDEPCNLAGCTGDFNSDGLVNVADLLLLLSGFGCTQGCTADLTTDGVVNASDLLVFLGVIGSSC